jgi:hypothetical protein
MIIRMISIPDSLDLTDFGEVSQTVLGWDGLGFILRVHEQEVTAFRRVTHWKTGRAFQLRPREIFLTAAARLILEMVSVFWAMSRGTMATRRRYVWAVVALHLRTLRRPDWQSADAKSGKSRSRQCAHSRRRKR